MSLESSFTALGFSPNESTVYLALFELGKVRAADIIEQTGLHRNIVYTALEELIRRNIVTKTLKSGVAEFVANNPQSFIDELEEKKRIAEALTVELREKREGAPREVTVYEGKEGIKRSRNKTLQYDAGETLYVLGSKASTTPDMERYWRTFHKKREERGIGLKILFEHGVDQKDLEWRNALAHSEAKYLPFKTDLPIWFAIIKDYLEIGIPGDDPLTFGIKSAEAAKGFQSFFEFFWDQDVVVSRGWNAFHDAFYNKLNALEKGEEYYILGATNWGHPKIVKFFEEFHKKRIQKGVVLHMLADRATVRRYEKQFPKQGDAQMNISHVREFISPLPQLFQINMYKGKTDMIVYGDNPLEPTVFSFTSTAIYQGFLDYYHRLWNQKATTEIGEEALHRTLYDMLDELRPGEMYYVLGATFGKNVPYTRDFYVRYHEERLKKGVAVKMLGAQDMIAEYKKTLAKKFPNYARLTHLKEFISPLPQPFQINLYHGKTKMIVYGEEPTVISFDGREVYEGFKTYFDALWK